MRPIRHFLTLAAILCGTLAHADITAQQVWDNWQDQVATFGDGFTTGDAVTSGNTLTISDVKIDTEGDDFHVIADIGDIKLTELGDGTVRITMPPSYPLTITETLEVGPKNTATLIVSQDNFSMTVSGEPDAMNYALTADRYAISVDSLVHASGSEVLLDAATLEFLDLSSAYTLTSDTLNNFDYTFGIGAMAMDFSFTDPASGDKIVSTATIADFAIEANAALPFDLDTYSDPPFHAGLAASAAYSFGNVAFSFDINAGGEVVSGSTEVDSGTTEAAFDFDGAAFSGGANGFAMTLNVPEEFPLPIEASLGGYGFDFQVPLSKAEGRTARDAIIAFNLTDLVVADALWNLVDPAEMIPRDPMTIALDLRAKIIPLFDFLDPAQQQAVAAADLPVEIESLDIKGLTLRGLGASISGMGAFTFDNDDYQTFPDFPRPQGEAELAINGVNGLIDIFIEMGLIPADQALVPRLVMGTMTVPVGDDQLTSEIEINEEGHVFANGQRLR